ncbi:MAG: NUDIX hydrolase [Bacteroidota bacterium]
MIEAHIFRMVDNVPEFLLLKRSELEVYPGIWQMVTGSSNQEERALQTVVREIKEETDLLPKRLWVVPFINSFYSWKRNHICLVPVFAAMVENDARVRISEEHTEYKWVSRDEAVEMLAWIGQRSSVNYIYDFFTTKNSSLNFEEINMSRIRNNNSSR